MLDIGLQQNIRISACRLLNTLLADEFLLSTKTKNYHWNVTGPHFLELHAFFGEQYRMLDERIDRIAERIRALGGIPVGTLVSILREARLAEHPPADLGAWAMVENLLHDHEALIRDIRADLNRNSEAILDAGTADFLTTLLQDHEAAAWTLRSLRTRHAGLESWLSNQEKVTCNKQPSGELNATSRG